MAGQCSFRNKANLRKALIEKSKTGRVEYPENVQEHKVSTVPQQGPCTPRQNVPHVGTSKQKGMGRQMTT